MIPLVFLLAAIGLQGGVYMWAATNTNEAARQGARAQSLGQDGCAAVAATLGGSLDLESCSATGGPNPFSPTRLDVRVRVRSPCASWANPPYDLMAGRPSA
jgi:hypothetical protein